MYESTVGALASAGGLFIAALLSVAMIASLI
jgi:hypothetical protein